MAVENIRQEEPIGVILTELGIRINELEEKQRLLKDRMLLIGNNLIGTKEEIEKQIFDFKKQFKQIEFDIKGIKQLNERIVGEIGNFARKNELEILKRQMKMFEPLEFARIEDVKKIIQDELKKLNK